jgi:hypothetical protein
MYRTSQHNKEQGTNKNEVNELVDNSTQFVGEQRYCSAYRAIIS